MAEMHYSGGNVTETTVPWCGGGPRPSSDVTTDRSKVTCEHCQRLARIAGAYIAGLRGPGAERDEELERSVADDLNRAARSGRQS